MYSNSQTNLDFGQSSGLNKARKAFGFGQFETEEDYTGLGLYSRAIDKDQLQYYNQLPDPSFFGSGANNAIGEIDLLSGYYKSIATLSKSIPNVLCN